jgi:DNA repair photolyase
MKNIIEDLTRTREATPSNGVKKTEAKSMVAGIWTNDLQINPNKFVHKSLSDWSVNIAVGCCHKCKFCSVASTSTNKQFEKLKCFDVDDPDAEWGNYVLLRKFDEDSFMSSLMKAELRQDLSFDGNRAIIYCSTTDPYQTITGVPNHKQLNEYARFLVRHSLELIRDCSTLNVRILTRSPLAKSDFDLFKSFGNRLVFGMSLPTLNEKVSRIYEPDAPSVLQRLKTLQAAKEAGLHVYVAVAPTYPECDEADLRRTLKALKKLDPITIFHEPINIRAENVERIRAYAKSIGEEVKLDVFDNGDQWRKYSMEALMKVHAISEELEIAERLKLWPDAGLTAKGPFLALRKKEFARLNPDHVLTKEEKGALEQLDLEGYDQFHTWVKGWWDKISEWPGVTPQAGWTRPSLLTACPFTPVTLEQVRERAAQPAAVAA